ncbi:MAG TPA: YebC/PmpR family DNA-binding transcriptional regulator [Candidatus Paceibacterota bacterium]
MSGHSKWKQIKEKKGTADKKRSKEFSKLSRLITVESRVAKGDVSSSNLRAMIERARSADMPKENIERAIARGIGAGGDTLEQVTYETYGPGGVAILIDAFTDNRNRTNQELKFLLSEMGYAVASPGSASWAFTKSPEGEWHATTTVPVLGEDAGKLAVLIEKLESHEDVEHVTTNAD